MVLLSYFVAGPEAAPPGQLVWLLAGSLLALCGASALNQLLEREADGRMRRTATRPLPAGRMAPRRALVVGAGLSLAGFALLALGVNGLTAVCAIVGWAAYLFVYTPMKPRSSLSTVVGAVPGAVPVLMGWAAARGSLDAYAWTLFCILFLWQLPHFLAIAWMYRADYARAGFRMLPVESPDGDSTIRQIVGYSLALLPVSLVPALVGMAGGVYFAGALVLGAAYLASGLRLGQLRTGQAAKQLVRVSVLYLPLLFLLLALDGALTG
jgi:protoheme IX farnesyltransferase